MFKKVISIGLLCLVSATTFASPLHCARDSLAQWGVSKSIINQQDHIGEIALPKYPRIHYSEFKQGGLYYAYTYFNLEGAPPAVGQKIVKDLSYCHCANSVRRDPNPYHHFHDITGYCWKF